MHEEAFRQLEGVPEEILYDRMRTVWEKLDDRGEVVWNPLFLDFARYGDSSRGYARPTERRRKGGKVGREVCAAETSCAGCWAKSRAGWKISTHR